MPDLDAEIIPRRICFRHSQKKSSASAADIEKQRPVRFREDRFDIDRLRRLSVERRERINVLMNSYTGHLVISAKQRSCS